MANKKNTINIKIGASSKQFTSEIKKVQRTLRKQGRKMKQLGQSMTTSLTLPLVGLGLVATKTTAEFEQAMAKVKAISGATGKQFEMLNDNALELGRTTRYTASQVASLQLNLSKLGFNPTEIKQATASILDLALATGEDLADSATTVAATIKGFNLTAKDSGHVADVMAKSFSSSALDLHKFSTAMAVVAPVANKANVSLEEAAAILGTLTDRGVDAGTSGVSLRNIYLDLAENGLSWADAMNQLKSSSDPLALSMQLFGKRGATVATIIADNVDQIDKMTQSLANSDGASEAMAKIMDDTLNGALLRMKSALEGVAIEVGTHLTPKIKSLTESVIKLSDWFTNLSDENKNLAITTAGLVASTGPLLYILGNLRMSYAALVPSMAKVAKMAGMTELAFVKNLGVIGLFAGAIIAVVVGLRKLNKYLADNTIQAKEVRHQQGKLTESNEALKGAIDDVKAATGGYVQISEDARAEMRLKTEEVINNTIANMKNAMSMRRQMKAELELAQQRAFASTQGGGGTLTTGVGFEAAMATVSRTQKDIEKIEDSLNDSNDLVVELMNSLEDLDNKKKTIETGGYKPGGKEDEERKLAEQRLKWEDQLRLIKIENGKDEYKRLIGIAEFHSDMKKREIEEENKGADLKTQRNDLLFQEEVRLEKEKAQILKDFNKKKSGEKFDQEMADLEKLYDEKETKALQNAKTEEGYDAESLKNTRAYLAAKLEIYERYGENVSAIQLAIAQLDYDTTTGMTENLTDAEQRMKDTMASISSLIQSFVTDQVIGLIDAIGQELNGSTKAIDRWADNILKSFGEFISKLGAMMMAYGTAKLVIGKGAPGPAMIAAGAVMVGLGGAIKQHIKRKEEKALEANGGGGLDGGYSSQLNSSNNYGSGQNVVVLETVVYGNDILLSSNRQHNTVERTRRK